MTGEPETLGRFGVQGTHTTKLQHGMAKEMAQRDAALPPRRRAVA
jgi:hypothetical protein